MKEINYVKDIYGSLDKYYYSQQWEKKSIVIFGLSVLGQVIASYFDNKKTKKFYIVDNKKAGKVWMDQCILKPAEVIPNLSDDAVILIAPRDKSITE